jgi:hypothetical protein
VSDQRQGSDGSAGSGPDHAQGRGVGRDGLTQQPTGELGYPASSASGAEFGQPVGGDHGADLGKAAGGESGADLEQFITHVARAQPPRRAPVSLEARVLAQISALPWWRKGFTHWPLPARVAFLVASLGFIKIALTGFISLVDLVSTSDLAGVNALHRTGAAVSTTVSLGETVFHAIPATWLYTGAAVGFALYALLFALGTFAYRTLYVQR